MDACEIHVRFGRVVAVAILAISELVEPSRRAIAEHLLEVVTARPGTCLWCGIGVGGWVVGEGWGWGARGEGLAPKFVASLIIFV